MTDLKETKIEKIIQKYEGTITGLQDLTGDSPPSELFYILANHFRYLMDINPEVAVSVRDIKRSRRLKPVIKALGARFLSSPQLFENRNILKNPNLVDAPPDLSIILPKEPVIWVSNHGFKDDVLATILAVKRPACILFGSLPQFYNTFDGVTAWLSGVVMMNRKVAASKRTIITKAVRAMRLGADLVVFPEGVWNKSPNALMLNLWPGIYRIACETGAKIVPISHYIRDCSNYGKNNPIHTVVDDSFRIDDLSEQAALDYVRDILATWFYLMMERYGKTTRAKLLRGAESSVKVWEQQLIDRVKTVACYDKEIETYADYRPKWKTLPQDVWSSVANISKVTKDNILYVLYARQLLEQLEREDFQRRF